MVYTAVWRKRHPHFDLAGLPGTPCLGLGVTEKGGSEVSGDTTGWLQAAACRALRATCKACSYPFKVAVANLPSAGAMLNVVLIIPQCSSCWLQLVVRSASGNAVLLVAGPYVCTRLQA